MCRKPPSPNGNRGAATRDRPSAVDRGFFGMSIDTLLCGVHWLTDILLSGSLVAGYTAALRLADYDFPVAPSEGKEHFRYLRDRLPVGLHLHGGKPPVIERQVFQSAGNDIRLPDPGADIPRQPLP